jgi:Terminase large subunit, T4likevirus-type, N-terminal/Terminase RNaseH-like domain
MRTVLRSRASRPQAEFVNSKAKFPALVAGFGSGKTAAGILRALRLKFEYPRLDVAYYLPTYDLVRMIGYPRFSEILSDAKIKYRLNKAEHIISIKNRGRIIFRTLDNPDRIVGYEVADSIVDELDTLKLEDATRAWQQIIARNRQKKPDKATNTVGVATTPEGFKFVYDRWHKAPTQGYELIRATTYSNARNLPDDYIDALKRSYPSQLIAAYLDGQFVNLTSGAVYPEFSRLLNHTDAAIEASEPLHIGLDFNVYNCTAITGAIREKRPLILGELTGLRDTPAMIASIKEHYVGHHITVYPDASGRSNKTVNASLSDLQLLEDAGFAVCANDANPLVKDRVMAVNALIECGTGARSLLVNTTACPVVTECLEQQVYDKNGEPDKSTGKDHAPDGLGYFINYTPTLREPEKPPCESVLRRL